MKYRAEIDGLRAVAVLPVILFHAGFEVFSGGFVGVDVFFVISGYLITTIIISELEQGKFSLLLFYERRARRILPALFFVLIGALPFAWIWLSPSDLKEFGQSLIAVSIFASNIFFWQETGYFATAAELKPLLHTWSLAVEEQYYIFFPLFLMLTWRFGVRPVLVLIGVFFVASLILGHWGAVNTPVAAFFLLPTRAWELLVGVFAAFYLRYSPDFHQNSSSAVHQALSMLGLVMVLYSIFAFDKETLFPGLPALVPTVGTALIIVSASPGTWVNRLLSIKGLVGIGLISYSAYLWHQPLLVFTRHWSLTAPSETLMGLACTLTLVMAYVSWRYVERPFRQKQAVSRGMVFSAGAFATIVIVAVGLIGNHADGFAGRFDMPKSVLASFRTVGEARKNECFEKSNVAGRDDWYCELGADKSDPSIMIFGDSHALSLLPAFENVTSREGIRGVFAGTSGCPPLLGVYSLRADQATKSCKALNDKVFEFVSGSGIRKLFLVARWSYYTDGGYSSEDFNYLSLVKDGDKSVENSRNAFRKGMKNTVDQYKKIGIEVFIIPQVPQQEIHPKMLYIRSSEEKFIRDKSIKYYKHKYLQKYSNHIIYKSDATIVNLDEIYCDEGSCVIGNSNISYYYDEDHLSIDGSILAEKVLLKHIKD